MQTCASFIPNYFLKCVDIFKYDIFHEKNAPVFKQKVCMHVSTFDILDICEIGEKVNICYTLYFLNNKMVIIIWIDSLYNNNNNVIVYTQEYCLTPLNAEKTCGMSFFPPDIFLVALILYHILLWCSFSDSFAATILAASSGGIPWSRDSCPSSWIDTNDQLKWDKVSCFKVAVLMNFDLFKSILGHNVTTKRHMCKVVNNVVHLTQKIYVIV